MNRDFAAAFSYPEWLELPDGNAFCGAGGLLTEPGTLQCFLEEFFTLHGVTADTYTTWWSSRE